MGDTSSGNDLAMDGASWPPSPATRTTPAAPVQHRALRHSVADHVVAALRNGQLAPGARVHETSLARALDVSLSPVREALFKLADQGVLEHRPRRGFFVKQLSEAETREVYTFRALLEGFAARAAAEQEAAQEPQESKDLAAMEYAIELGRQAALKGERMVVGEWNARFHDQLVKLAGHGLLARAWGMLAPVEWLLVPTWTWPRQPFTAAEIDDWVARHRRLLAVIRSGDSNAAEREAREHVLVAGEANIRRRFAPPPEIRKPRMHADEVFPGSAFISGSERFPMR